VQFSRTENPPRFENYRVYLPFLRRDFRRSCAYCERNELVLGGEDFFEIDHFRPISRFAELVNHYPNLYYTCAKCNRCKASTWTSDTALNRGLRFADPCQEDMYSEHLEQLAGGELRPKTSCGAYTCDHIRLNRPDLLQWRQGRTRIGAEIKALESLVAQLRTMTETVLADDRERLRQQVSAVESRVQRLREQYG